MSAYEELVTFLDNDEEVEAIAFGPWGWGVAPGRGRSWKEGFGEPTPPPVPFDERGKLMSLAEAKPMMQSWSFDTSWGAPECYAVYVWTDKRVIWVTQYDGSTHLDSAPRHPATAMPSMPGG